MHHYCHPHLDFRGIQANHPFLASSFASPSRISQLTGVEHLAPLSCKSLKCQRAPTASLSVSPCSGQYLLCSSPEAASLALYDLCQRQQDCHPMPPIRIKNNVFQPITSEATSMNIVRWWPIDSGLFTTLSRHRLSVWDAHRFQSDFELKLDVPAYCQEYASVSKYHLFVAVGTQQGIRLCDLKSGSQAQVLREPGGDNRVTCLTWSPYDEHCIVSGGHAGGLLKMWDVRREGPLYALKDSEMDAHARIPIASLAFSRDALSLLTLNERGSLHVWDPNAKSQVPYARADEKKVQWREALPSAAIVALKRGYFAVPHLNRVQLLEYETASRLLAERKALIEHWDQVIALDYNYHLEELVSAGRDNQIVIWGLGK